MSQGRRDFKTHLNKVICVNKTKRPKLSESGVNIQKSVLTWQKCAVYVLRYIVTHGVAADAVDAVVATVVGGCL